MYCNECGSVMSDKAESCPACGAPNQNLKGKKDKVVFVILALLLGGLGIHRFYLGGGGNIMLGIVYLIFCWTFIPTIIAIFEAIIIGLRKDDPRFNK